MINDPKQLPGLWRGYAYSGSLSSPDESKVYEICAKHLEQALDCDKWTPTSERLPTEEDVDCEGLVWYYYPGWPKPFLLLAQKIEAESNSWWMPTNLKRPEAPKV